MLKRRTDEMSGQPMDMAGAEGVTMRMLLGSADGAPTFAMRHFTVEPGGHSPLHQHNYEHGVQIMGGRGTIEIDGETGELRAGDSLFVPPNVVHQFRADRGESLQFICIVPTTFDCGQPTPGS